MPRQEREKKRKNDEEKLSPTEKTDTLVVPLTGSRSIIHAFQPGIIHSLSPTAFTFTLNLHLPQDGKPRLPNTPSPSLPHPLPPHLPMTASSVSQQTLPFINHTPQSQDNAPFRHRLMVGNAPQGVAPVALTDQAVLARVVRSAEDFEIVNLR